jgi:hypothetical protein
MAIINRVSGVNGTLGEFKMKIGMAMLNAKLVSTFKSDLVSRVKAGSCHLG